MTNVTSRTLTVHCTAIPEFMGEPALAPVRLSGSERLNGLFEYELIVRTPDALSYVSNQGANFPIATLLGVRLTVRIELEDFDVFDRFSDNAGGMREISGLVTEARFLREEGRQALYRLTLRPWLHLATLTTDCRIFQDKNVVEILDAVLADYAFVVEKRLCDDYPKRDYRTQWRETDFQFMSRLCEEWGIAFFFVHSEGTHRLVLADAMSSFRANPGSASKTLSFHPPGYRIDEPYIHAFVSGLAMTSSTYVTTDYDYTRPRADLLTRRMVPPHEAASEGEIFDWHSDSHFVQPMAGPQQQANDPWIEGRELALRRMEALRTPGVFAQGSGHLRGMVPGHTFRLAKHPTDDANAEYLIVGARLDIEDIGAESSVARAAAQGLRSQRFRVEADFDLFPSRKSQYRPPRCTPRPRTHGPQTAMVVGPKGKNVWTDEFGRIKVQFPWDRRGTQDADSSCWVRVVSPWAGNQLGGTHVPRIGQEVIVDFLGGNPDLPICVGRVHNQMNMPSWRLPEQYAISGFRSRELTAEGGNSSGGRSNHLLLDDTDAKIQAQLNSDHEASQLNLGHITRIEKNAGRKDYRGHGFELRTDGHGVLRAGYGMLITSEKRTGGSGHTLASGETAQRLKTACEQHQGLAETAREAGAQDKDDDQSDVVAELQRQNEQIEGTQPPAGSAGEGFPEFSAPHLLLASPVGIETTTAGSTHIASGGHFAVTSGRHTSISAGGNLVASVKGAIRLFAQRAGIRMISALADIDIKALQQSINLLAKLDVTVTAERVTISAAKEVLINGGGSYSKWTAGGIEHGSAGAVTSYVASQGVLGARNKALPELPTAPSQKEALALSVGTFPLQGAEIGSEPYALYRGAALVGTGLTDGTGRVVVDEHKTGTGAYKVKLTNGAEFDLAVSPKLDPRSSQQQLSNSGFRGNSGKTGRADDYPSTT